MNKYMKTLDSLENMIIRIETIGLENAVEFIDNKFKAIYVEEFDLNDFTHLVYDVMMKFKIPKQYKKFIELCIYFNISQAVNRLSHKLAQ